MKKFLAIILALACMLPVLSACTKESSVSYCAEGIVRIAYVDIDSVCENEALLLEGQRVLTAMQDSESILLSFVVDSEILITSEELAGYDHLVVTNPQWIDTFAETAVLTPIDYDHISVGMQNFLTAHMSLWTKDGSVLPEGVSLYEYNGPGLLAFPANVGLSAEAIQAKNPLIVMLDAPVTIMNEKAFLLPLTSSGNLVFSDEDKLNAELESSCLAPYLSEIRAVRK